MDDHPSSVKNLAADVAGQTSPAAIPHEFYFRMALTSRRMLQYSPPGHTVLLRPPAYPELTNGGVGDMRVMAGSGWPG